MTEPTFTPYAPPTAAVADVAPATRTAELRMFSPSGRIGRLRYLAYGTGASVIYKLVVTAVAMLTRGGMPMVALTLAMLAALLWFNVVTGIKRCHDVGVSGWWSLTLIIPVIVLVWILWPGKPEENRFGPPPPPNNWGVRLLGIILPLVFFFGILAAIAIPQYQMYVAKARAVQSANPR